MFWCRRWCSFPCFSFLIFLKNYVQLYLTDYYLILASYPDFTSFPLLLRSDLIVASLTEEPWGEHPQPKQQTNLCWSPNYHQVYSCCSVGLQFSKERWKPDCFTHTCSWTSLGYTPVSEGAQLIADLAHLQWQHTKVQFQELSMHSHTNTHILSRLYTLSHKDRSMVSLQTSHSRRSTHLHWNTHTYYYHHISTMAV